MCSLICVITDDARLTMENKILISIGTCVLFFSITILIFSACVGVYVAVHESESCK